MRKNTIAQRLNIVKGQIDGLSTMIEKKEDCRKVTEQFHAINAGLKKAMELYLKESLFSCFSSAILKKKKKINFLLKEIIKNK